MYHPLTKAAQKSWWAFLKRKWIALLIFVSTFTLLVLLILRGRKDNDVQDSPTSSSFGNLLQEKPPVLCRSDNREGHEYPSALEYALVIDAGSTGTRIHVYTLSYCASQVVSLENEVFHEVPLGLHSFVDKLDDIHDQLVDPLLQIALRHVPVDRIPRTPLTLKATAGLRKLPEDSVLALLNAVKQSFARYDFPWSNDAVSVISGKEEGVWGWMAINFLLNNIGYGRHRRDTDKGKGNSRTAAMMDLGGASTQLVFQLDSWETVKYKKEIDALCQKQLPDPSICHKLKDLVYELDFSGQVYHLFQHSFLGFGLMEARKSVKEAFLERQQDRVGGLLASGMPCLPSQYRELFQRRDSSMQPSWVNGTFSAEPEDCHEAIQNIFPFGDECPVSPCAFQGIPLPSSLKDPSRDLFAFSYFYDRLAHHVLTDVSPQHVPLSAVEDLVKQQCSLDQRNRKVQGDGHECLDLMYLKTLLMDGYQLPSGKALHLVKKINGIETCWALGAALSPIL